MSQNNMNNNNNSMNSIINSNNINNSNSQYFYKLIKELKEEKNVIEKKLSLVENELEHSESFNEKLYFDKEQLLQELDTVMRELSRAKMSSVIRDEE